jgi:DNA-binding response OmpR family regulator
VGHLLDLSGRRILILEDEAIISMVIEDVLTEAGCKDVVAAANVDQALEAANSGKFDLAILDINVAGKSSFPVAEKLAAAGAPFMFVSGYGAAGITDKRLKAPVLGKPFTVTTLERAIERLLSGAADVNASQV